MIHFLKNLRLRIHGFDFVFTPKLIPSLIFLALFYMLIKLGFWQLDRGHFKQQRERAYQTRQQLPAQNFKPSNTYPLYSQLKLHGFYDNAHSFLLDNSIYNHHVGFQVFTPFKLANDPKPILINRGWVAGAPDHQVLPKITTIEGPQHLKGLISDFPKKTFVLAKQVPSSQWPQVVERLKQSELEGLLQEPLESRIILLLPGQTGAFSTNPAPQLAMPAQRHFGYAIQWFALALTLVIIGLVLSIHREKFHGSD